MTTTAQSTVAVTHQGVRAQHFRRADLIARKIMAGACWHSTATCIHAAALSNKQHYGKKKGRAFTNEPMNILHKLKAAMVQELLRLGPHLRVQSPVRLDGEL